MSTHDVALLVLSILNLAAIAACFAVAANLPETCWDCQERRRPVLNIGASVALGWILLNCGVIGVALGIIPTR